MNMVLGDTERDRSLSTTIPRTTRDHSRGEKRRNGVMREVTTGEIDPKEADLERATPLLSQ